MVYLIGYRSYPDRSGLVYYFYERANSVWTKVDSSNNTDFGDKLFKSPSGTIYSFGKGGVYKLNNDKWVNIFSTYNYISGLWATSDENIFAVSNGNGGIVYHYNGSDWKQIGELYDPKGEYWSVWANNTDAFVVGHIMDGPYQKTIIWHGK